MPYDLQIQENQRQLINSQRSNTLGSADLHLAMARSSGQPQQKPSQASGNGEAPPYLVPSWEGQFNSTAQSVLIVWDITSYSAAAKPNQIHTDLEIPSEAIDFTAKTFLPTKSFFIQFQHFQQRVQVLQLFTSLSLV
jgi:hypothetical protein